MDHAAVLNELNQKWGLAHHLNFTESHNMTKACLKLDQGPSAELYLHGSHLVSFKDANGKELIFMSSKSNYELNKPIRGGIPVIFPQFGPGALPQHGFARTSLWAVKSTSRNPDPEHNSVEIALELKESENTLKIWPHPFSVVLTTKLSFVSNRPELRQTFQVVNTGPNPFTFTTALHTYFRIPQVTQATVQPLNVRYLDKIKGSPVEETHESVSPVGPIDRVYYKAPNLVKITDQGEPIMWLEKSFDDLVVWNCGKEGAKAIADMGDDDWDSYVCCEPGQIGEPVTLQPSQSYEAHHAFFPNAKL